MYLGVSQSSKNGGAVFSRLLLRVWEPPSRISAMYKTFILPGIGRDFTQALHEYLDMTSSSYIIHSSLLITAHFVKQMMR
jgi:hypothetical protein